MCGIAGIVDLENGCVDPRILRAMTNSLVHRGPDDEGYVLVDGRTSSWGAYSGPASPLRVQRQLPPLSAFEGELRPSIGLAHRRFSIIDLSERGHQPFFDERQKCCIVFNGEIYNYLELREELLADGAVLTTNSDTEVLLKAYQHWGARCFPKLNGFWAFALYDFEKRQLILSRDRLGKRPLYWTRIGSQIYFGSEIKALLEAPAVRRNRKVNEAAIYSWLTLGRKDLDFSTCFEGIYSLPSASWVVVDGTFPKNVNTYWLMPSERLDERDLSIPEAVGKLRGLLEDAVRIRLRADVPLAVELSGGLDSSALVALAAQERADPITTYTVRFSDKRYNEEPYARSVAQRFKTDYRVLESPTANFWGQIRAFTYLEEEPYHSPNLQTNQVIWSHMRGMGTKVSLNGAGGDEDFAGYSVYYTPAQVENLQRGRFGAYLVNALRYSQGRTNIRGLIGPIAAMLRAKQSAQPPSYLKLKGRGAGPDPANLTDSLYSDMTNTLMPYWLRSGDRGYMGIPLEVRAPLLDYRVVELAFRLPTTYLLRNGWHKWIFRKAMEDLLPKDVVWRRRKMGFPFPFEQFYSDAEEILGILFENCQNPFIDLGKIRSVPHDWKLISFLLWYELFFNCNTQIFDAIEERSRCLYAEEDYGYAPEFLSTAGFAA